MSLAQKRSELIKSLPPITEVIRGSLVREYHKNCPCHPKGRYGPYWRLSVNEGGRTKMRQLQRTQVPQIRKSIKNYQRWWKTCLGVMEINTSLVLSRKEA